MTTTSIRTPAIVNTTTIERTRNKRAASKVTDVGAPTLVGDRNYATRPNMALQSRIGAPGAKVCSNDYLTGSWSFFPTEVQNAGKGLAV